MPLKAPEPIVKTAHAQNRENSSTGQINALKPILSGLTASEKVSKLMECENRDRITNLKVLDTNGKYSYGILQFQKQTLETYARRYGLRTEITEADLFNGSLQREVARKMLEENPKNISAWKNCAVKNNLL